MGKYYIRLECDSDESRAVGNLFVIIKSMAPYMVDNVDLDYGVINKDGVRLSATKDGAT
jgi:hypothetical protein